MPGLNGNGEILYFSGNQTPAVMGAVKAFTDPDSARNLVSKLDVPGGTLPRYYQVVLKVTSMDDMPIDVSYVFHRELAASRLRPRPSYLWAVNRRGQNKVTHRSLTGS